MKVNQYVAPTSEVVSLSELKLHLKIDAGSMSDGFTESQSIVPGSHAVTAGFTLFGAAVAVYGEPARASVNTGACGTGGTVDVKIQESATGVGDWVDWTGGAFTAITTANDNAIHEKEYTGSLDYIRTVAQITGAACEFGTSITQYEPTSDEDDLLTAVLAAARNHVENITRRQLVTATWDYTLEDWPDGDAIVLPFGNLASVTHVKYTDSDLTETTMTVTTDYTVETNGEQCGRIVLPYQGSWPSVTLSPSNPISIRFVCGYTTVPEMLKVAVKFAAENFWRHGGDNAALIELVNTLTASFRLYDEF
jgi:uncharacterized phiE125 gp8 family phage protein